MARKPPLPDAAPAEARARLVFLGAARVGKTALIRRFLQDAFEARHRRTVEELHVLELELGPPGPALRLRLEILDTSGSYSFPAMRRLGIRHGDAFALVYSPHEPGSFEEARRLRDEILEARPAAAPIVLVANKSDLGPAPEPSSGPRLAAKLQRDWGVRHVEASAKQGHNVIRLFQELLGRGDLLGGRLSPALRRRRSNPEAVAKEPPQPRRRPSPSCVVC